MAKVNYYKLSCPEKCSINSFIGFAPYLDSQKFGLPYATRRLQVAGSASEFAKRFLRHSVFINFIF